MELYRIIYVSYATSKPDRDELLDIWSGSEAKNKQKNISGILINYEDHFMQALEGPFVELNDLYHTIAKDDRHSKLRIISFDKIFKRDFPDWGMKVFSSSDHKGITEFLISKYGVKNEEFNFPVDPHNSYALLLDVYKYFHENIA